MNKIEDMLLNFLSLDTISWSDMSFRDLLLDSIRYYLIRLIIKYVDGANIQFANDVQFHSGQIIKVISTNINAIRCVKICANVNKSVQLTKTQWSTKKSA